MGEIWRVWTASGRADIDVLMERAGNAMGNGEYGRARLLLDEVLALAPDFAEGWNRRATLCYLMGDYVGSLADIDRVLALEPRHFGAIVGRAMIHIAAEQWKAALDDYRRALSLNPFLLERHQIIPGLEKKVEGEKL